MPELVEKEHTFGVLFQTRFVMNEVVRFILDCSPAKDSLENLLMNPSFQALCEISENAMEISATIHYLLHDAERILETKAEYNRLLVGPGPLPAPIWESVYLGREHLLFDEQTLQVRKCYQKHGLHFVREHNEPEDHLIIELEFLGYLIQEIFASEDDTYTKMLIEDQTHFLNEHLLKWVPKFCEKLLDATTSPLYHGAVALLKEYLELEKEVANFWGEVLGKTEVLEEQI